MPGEVLGSRVHHHCRAEGQGSHHRGPGFTRIFQEHPWKPRCGEWRGLRVSLRSKRRVDSHSSEGRVGSDIADLASWVPWRLEPAQIALLEDISGRFQRRELNHLDFFHLFHDGDHLRWQNAPELSTIKIIFQGKFHSMSTFSIENSEQTGICIAAISSNFD